MIVLKHSRNLTRLIIPLILLGFVFSALAPALTVTVRAQGTPKSVTIAGTIQSQVGCSKDWDPTCDKTYLTYDKANDLWSATFELPAGKYEYKAAINNAWDENYGAKAKAGGANIPLVLKDKTKVLFIYDHKTHWVTDSVTSVIASAPGSYQSKIGCSGDWKPDCFLSLLEDIDGTGTYTYTTTKIPKGSYEAKVAINGSWTENYGADGKKDGANIGFSVPEDNKEVNFTYDSKTHLLTVGAKGAPHGDITLAKAIWVTRDTIAWKVAFAKGNVYKLYYDPIGAMKLDAAAGVTGGKSITLKFNLGGLNTKYVVQHPELNGYSSLQIADADLAKVPDILKGQIALAATDKDGKLIDATSIQTAYVLDDLYGYDGSLGVVYSGNVPSLRVWAPTAYHVKLHLFDDSTTKTAAVSDMTFDPKTGVWSIAGQADWTNKFYLYEVVIYAPTTGKVEQNLVTDSYSLSLSTNSLRSQIVNLSDAKLKPADWDKLAKPTLDSPQDIVIYELQVRDFSINDQSIPEAERGTFKAFTETNSNGMKHLHDLAKAGLTHIHLLPAFDIASVEEDKTVRTEADVAALKSYPPDSDKQQAAIDAIKDKDGYNWGYDPYHYTVPEGSYSTNPDGSTRIVEFRQMVKALNDSGLRVVMDVVYNHTSASGEDDKSVLDKIVPGYYHRLTPDGKVATSTCCQNTATEHAMMEKLMIDSVITWAKEYKVDGFRFDLMGHHMVSNMLNVRKALDALTMDKDGVDGSKIYIYGEGWNFGEVQDNARGKNATQVNMAGTGIGTFNDRLRDAVRGGGPFNPKQEQGFITGLFYDPNTTDQGTKDAQKAKLLHYMDWIKISLAGNLKDYMLVDTKGNMVRGDQIDYNGQATGYAVVPADNILYDSAHDNESLFDAIQYKAAADATLADRVRMQNLGMDMVLLGQGIPFFQAGDDMLRSKSGDGDSFNSGDWFNALDFTYQSNNWGVGLPPNWADGNKDNWKILQPLLADPKLKPGNAEIMNSVAHFQEMLKIRKSSKLFRLQTAQEIKDQLKFLNNGPDAVSALIVMTLADKGATQIVVVFNSTNAEQKVKDASFASLKLSLHPVQAASADSVVKTASANGDTLTVPARTTAVFAVTQ